MTRTLAIVLLITVSCSSDYEPKFSGVGAFTHPPRTLVLQVMGGEESRTTLPGGESIGYRFAQWTKAGEELLVVQTRSGGEDCSDYQILTIDTEGAILDTVYQAPPATPLNFNLAPNDSLIMLKTYDSDCRDWSTNFIYTFYNRHLKTALPDTIKVGNTLGLLLDETLWSPDSRKVIIPQWSGPQVKAFVYDLATKDSTYIDKGSNFIWSPTDNNIVSYIKDYSIYTKNIVTGETELLYEGKKKKGAHRFRWSPQGDYLRIHVRSYMLNVEAPMTQRTVVVYLSLPDKKESRTFLDDQHIDTWR